MNKKEIIVEKNKKLVTILQDYGFSFADVNKMLRSKDVKVDGNVERENVVIESGSKVTFFYSDDMLGKKYDVVYENADVVIVYKKVGIETSGENGLESVVPNAIAVHRLDRNTEGLVVFAKNTEAEKKLLSAFKGKGVHKFYVAEVVGDFDVKSQIFSAYLAKDDEKSLVKIFDKKKDGTVKIQTKVNTIKHAKESSLVEIELLTGKTHQIRAHLAYLGHPIIGDGKYGKNEDNKKFGMSRQKLACFKMTFEDIKIKGLDGKTLVKKPKWLDF